MSKKRVNTYITEINGYKPDDIIHQEKFILNNLLIENVACKGCQNKAIEYHEAVKGFMEAYDRGIKDGALAPNTLPTFEDFIKEFIRQEKEDLKSYINIYKKAPKSEQNESTLDIMESRLNEIELLESCYLRFKETREL